MTGSEQIKANETEAIKVARRKEILVAVYVVALP
jgi:hypothetical protein